jgi:hypothetical protein
MIVGERTIAMKLLPMSRVALIGALCIGAAGAASIAPRSLNNLEGHHSSLQATLTMADGTVRAVTLAGVGCPQDMCSRVRAKDVKAGSVWLDGLTSVWGISHTAGPVTATFKFKDGTERHTSIIAANRVLYVQRHFGLTEKLDLGSVRKIDFE